MIRPPLLVSVAFTVPGPQIPRTTAETVTFLILNLLICLADIPQGRFCGVSPAQLTPLKIAEVIRAVPVGPMFPVRWAVQGRDTAPAVTVIPPTAVKEELSASK